MSASGYQHPLHKYHLQRFLEPSYATRDRQSVLAVWLQEVRDAQEAEQDALSDLPLPAPGPAPGSASASFSTSAELKVPAGSAGAVGAVGAVGAALTPAVLPSSATHVPPPDWKEQVRAAFDEALALLHELSLGTTEDHQYLISSEGGFRLVPSLCLRAGVPEEVPSLPDLDAEAQARADFYQGVRDGLRFMYRLVSSVNLPVKSRYVSYQEYPHGGVATHASSERLWPDLVEFLHQSDSRANLEGRLAALRLTRFDLKLSKKPSDLSAGGSQPGSVLSVFNLPFRRLLHDSSARDSGAMRLWLSELVNDSTSVLSNKIFILAVCQVLGNLFQNVLSGMKPSKLFQFTMQESWILMILNYDGAVYFRHGAPAHCTTVDTLIKAQNLAYQQPKALREEALRQAVAQPVAFAQQQAARLEPPRYT